MPSHSSPSDLLAQSARCVQAGQFQAASVLLEQAALIGPKSAEWHHLHGLLEWQNGRHAAALADFDASLRLDARHFDVWNNRGILLRSLQRATEAQASFRAACELRPHSINFRANLATCLQDLGRHTEAEPLLRATVEALPENPEAHYALGITLEALRLRDDAEKSYRQALVLQPSHLKAGLNLAAIAGASGRATEAEQLYRKLLATNPKEPMGYYKLSLLLAERGPNPEVEVLLQAALKLSPGFSEAWIALGKHYLDRHRIKDATTAFERAEKIDPNSAYLWNCLGLIHQMESRHKEAERCYRGAIRLQPEFAPALTNLGHLLSSVGRLAEAEEYYQKALTASPRQAEALKGLGNLCAEGGRHDEAVQYLRQAIALQPENLDNFSNFLQVLIHQGVLSPTALLEEARGWEKRIPAFQKFPPRRPASSRLRVGYVSSDFRKHAVSYFISPILAAHDRRAVEVFCYANVPVPDDRTESIRQLADHWHPIHGLNDDEAAQLIRKHAIDVLVDLSGHTQGHRLGIFARQPAPVQATWLGYFASTGLSSMHYWITDAIIHPTPTSEPAAEAIWRLPRCWLTYRASEEAPPPTWSRRERPTFGSFNNFAKISAPAIGLWALALRKLPESTLYLKSFRVPDPRTRARLLALFADHGIAADRIEFGEPQTSLTDHFAKYQIIDVALDPTPYTGGTTTVDALWMGVPTVTLPGETHRSRMSASLLTAAGFPEWIATSPEDFADKAVALALKTRALSTEANIALRQARRERMAASELCDAVGMARALENAFAEMAARA